MRFEVQERYAERKVLGDRVFVGFAVYDNQTKKDVAMFNVDAVYSSTTAHYLALTSCHDFESGVV